MTSLVYGAKHWLRISKFFFQKNVKVKGCQCTDNCNQVSDLMQDKLSNLMQAKLSNLLISFRKSNLAEETLLMNTA